MEILLCVMGMAYRNRREKEASVKVQAVKQKDNGAFHVEALELSFCCHRSPEIEEFRKPREGGNIWASFRTKGH